MRDSQDAPGTRGALHVLGVAAPQEAEGGGVIWCPDCGWEPVSRDTEATRCPECGAALEVHVLPEDVIGTSPNWHDAA